MQTAVDRKDILERFLHEVWSEGRAEESARYLAAAYTIHHDPGDPWDRRTLDVAGFEDRVRRSRAPFPDQCFDVREMIEDGDAVAVTWSWSGTHRGELAGFAATGRRIHMTGTTIYYFDDDDRLTGHWQIVDRLGVFGQLRA
jgi:predicted ester cyclase